MIVKRMKYGNINNNFILYKKQILISDLEIFMTIKGKNTQQILNIKSARINYNKPDNPYKDFICNTKPSEILVNENKINKFEENNITYIKITNLSSSPPVTNMAEMFYGCKYLLSIDIINIDTSYVTNMNSMLRECYNLISLDLSLFLKLH